MSGSTSDGRLLYAEGYACCPIGLRVLVNWAWCLDSETAVDSGVQRGRHRVLRSGAAVRVRTTGP